MGAVWLRLRAELRHRWRGWLALAMLLGLIGGSRWQPHEEHRSR
jgi:hypothetical protein